MIFFYDPGGFFGFPKQTLQPPIRRMKGMVPMSF
jgi:hypothetical protein